MTPRGLPCRSKIISGLATGATGLLGPMQFYGGCAGAIGLAVGVVTRCRITSAPMRGTVAKVVARLHLAGDEQYKRKAVATGGWSQCRARVFRSHKKAQVRKSVLLLTPYANQFAT